MLSQDFYLVLDPISARKKIRAAVKSVTNRARWGDSLLLLIKKKSKSGKSGKSSKSNPNNKQEFRDTWMTKITALEGRSLVLHCCGESGCGPRLACAVLESVGVDPVLLD